MKQGWRYSGVMALILLGTACGTKDDQTPLMMEISSQWEFRDSEKQAWLPATVPGTVHADLMKNGVIEDPHFALNESDVQWVEKQDWEYQTTFEVAPSILEQQFVELQFKGLDTYADVFLNDSLLLQVDNMFVEHRIGVKNHLVAGANSLRIYFHSPVEKGLARLRKLDYLIPAINEQAPENERTNIFTRKAPFHYGWDWGPRLVTSGIWRPVVLKAWSNALIEDVYLETRSASEEAAEVFARVEIMAAQDGDYTLNLDVEGASAGVDKLVALKAGQNFVDLTVTVKNPRLWWTNGLGEPNLYQVAFRLEDQKKVLDRHEVQFGIRTLRLVQEPDSAGRTFYFELNGVPVFMKGANVIPSETLTPKVSLEKYRSLIQNSVDANMNMLRVWGGAIYEEDYFYQLCDENGLLVWQDFMFACAMQPGDEAHLENIRKEAVYNVKRLRNHPSMALWCGNNENLHGWHKWGWKTMHAPEISDSMWRTYERIFYEILPAAVAAYDPKTSYWSSSPTSYNDQLADRKSGDEHDWTIWFGRKPFSAFGQEVPRFVSEYGLQSFPDMHTIGAFANQADHAFDSPVMRQRQRSKMPYVAPGFDGNDMIKWYMGEYYKVPADFKEFVYVSQVLQAYSYKSALEAHRRAMPHCMGSLYWQLNDSWPTISWSSVDYYGRWKASHYAVRDANQAVIVSPVMKDGRFHVYAVSDRLKPLEAHLKITLMNFKGANLFNLDTAILVPANTSTLVFNEDIKDIIAMIDTRDMFVNLVLHTDETVIADNNLFFNEPRDLNLLPATISLNLEKTEQGYRIQLVSDVLARDVYLDSPYWDLFFSDNYFDLLPGEKKTVEVVTDKELTDKEFVVMTLNNLVY